MAARRIDYLDHPNIENAVRYLGVDVKDALTLPESTHIRAFLDHKEPWLRDGPQAR